MSGNVKQDFLSEVYFSNRASRIFCNSVDMRVRFERGVRNGCRMSDC
jgi:hypothetical protein